MEDQYFGPLKTKIADFMADVDEQLWKLGITVKTQHNEVAPGQHAYMNGHLTTAAQSRVCRADHNSDGSKEVAICQGKDGEKYERKCG